MADKNYKDRLIDDLVHLRATRNNINKRMFTWMKFDNDKYVAGRTAILVLCNIIKQTEKELDK